VALIALEGRPATIHDVIDGRADVLAAAIVAKDIVAGGLTIISDNYQDGHPGNATNTFFVPKDSPIRAVADLKGKKVGVNAFGSAVDLDLRVVLKQAKLDPRRDLEIVEVAFPNMAPAIREKRIDCGVLVIPFLAVEAPKGDLWPLFTGGDAFGPSSVVFQVVTNDFLKAHPEAVKAYLADYVQGLRWYYDPANRTKAIELIADFTKSPKEILDSYFATARDYYRDPNGCISADLIQKPIDAMMSEKLIAQTVDVSKYIDTTYLPAACPA
jgi:sulfonate transport system substrate-binding protein